MNNDQVKRLLVTGSRYWTDRDKVARVLHPYRGQGLVLVHGKAGGLDLLAKDIWNAWGETEHGIRAEWEKHGKRAGPVRNQAMIDLGGYIACIAFPGPSSIGTWDCVRRAVSADIPTLVVQ